MKVLGNPWFATVVTLLPGLALAFGGYANIWPLFGASNQLLGGMTMITLAVFCKCTGRKGWMLYVPVVFLLCCTFTSLVQSAMGCMTAVQAYGFFGTIPATATRLRRPADGPGPHRCRQLPQGVLRQGGRFHARRGARVVRDGQGRVWPRRCRRGSCRRRGRQGLVSLMD